jgi:hypothetical protein
VPAALMKTNDVIKNAQKLAKPYRVMKQTVFCKEGQQLKDAYEMALRGWKRCALVSPTQPVAPASEADAVRLREAALAERNAAADRMYVHRSRCACCRRQR